MQLYLATLIYFDADRQLKVEPAGGMVVEQGGIVALGSRDSMREQYPKAAVIDRRNLWLLPGFVDAHVHYPQARIIASQGEQLLTWLERYTFPEEARFDDRAFARDQAEWFLDELTRQGTTSAAVFATVHETSAEQLFSAAFERNIRLMTGKVLMDRNCPENLRDTPEKGFEESVGLIERWHGMGRLEYALTPRFAPTSSAEQLASCTAVWDEFPGIALQTHLSENSDELAWVATLFPDAPDYVGVYEKFDLLRPRALFGHAIHLSEREAGALKEAGSSLVHCPTSNLFLGSGLFPWRKLSQAGHKLAMASDVAGGTSFSMLQTLKGAYEVSAMLKQPLSAADLLRGATLDAAEALSWPVGNLAPGLEADFLVVDPAATPVMSQRLDRADTWAEALFAWLMLGDDRSIKEVYRAGRLA